MVLQSYTLLVNGAECAVQIETAEQKTLPETTVPAASVEVAPQTFPVSGTEGSAVPGRAPQAQAYLQPTQATWVTARRVAHLPFH